MHKIKKAVSRRKSSNSRDGAQALVLTSKRNLSRQHQAKVMEYAQGILDKAEDGSPVPPELQVWASLSFFLLKNKNIY